ncbi:MAG: type II secretion system protein GspG [Myxococcota bacterium]
MNRLMKGFSLVEVMVAFLLVALAAGVVSVTVMSQLEKGRARLARTEAKSLQQAIILYRADHNSELPQDLSALYPDYIEKKKIEGPWGKPYEVRVPGKHNPGSFDVFTTNPKGEEFGNWKE